MQETLYEDRYPGILIIQFYSRSLLNVALNSFVTVSNSIKEHLDSFGLLSEGKPETVQKNDLS